MIIQTIKMALRALLLNKTRTFLTMLGIIIGIGAVIILISAGAGAQSLILDQVKGIGSNLLFVIPGGSGKNQFSAPAQAQGAVINSLTDADVQSLQNKDLAPDLQSVDPAVNGQFVVSYGQQDEQTTVAGEDQNYDIVSNLSLTEGSWFSQAQAQGFAQVAIIGSTLKSDLFGNQDPIGQIIKIKDLSFRVVGVLAPKGLGLFGVDQDSEVIVPVSTEQKILLGINYYSLIEIEVPTQGQINAAQDEVTKILESNHHITDSNKDDFTVRNQADAVSLLSTITSALTLFLSAIAGISLIVGGIGIMNIMLVSVTERTREIGLRKAIGATRRNILLQFLLEAVALTIAGGVFGIILGYIGAFGIAKVGGWAPGVPFYAIVLSVGVCALFGLVFGIYPANKASKLSPIEALRYE